MIMPGDDEILAVARAAGLIPEVPYVQGPTNHGRCTKACCTGDRDLFLARYDWTRARAQVWPAMSLRPDLVNAPAISTPVPVDPPRPPGYEGKHRAWNVIDWWRSLKDED